MTGAPYDRIVREFDAARRRLQPKEAEYLGLVLDPLESSGTVLDLGCGTGRPIGTRVASRGHRVVGVDASEGMLAIARRRLPEHRWIHGLMEHVELDERFDAVICWDALFHLPRRRFEPVIRKIHRWLEPGARLMVSSGGVVEGAGSGFSDVMFGHEFHYDSLPPDRMVATIEAIGFDVLVAEMCELPDGGRNRGKWATVASRR